MGFLNPGLRKVFLKREEESVEKCYDSHGLLDS